MASPDLLPCGEVVARLFESGKAEAYDTLIRLADDHINSVHYRDVQRHWLRLYTDASLARSELDLGGTEDVLLEGIKRVDMAIIVAGAIGKEDEAHDLINRLQRGIETKACVQWSQHQRQISPKHPPIREISAPSFEKYAAEEHKRPFIVRNYAEWPAITRWASTDYLIGATGEGRVVPVETGGSYVENSWGQKIMSWRTFLETCGREQLYLAQHDLFKQFPTLERDIIIPDYAWTHLNSEDPRYQRVEPSPNVWIGGETLSPAHTDPHNNCYFQVLGRKRVWIASPEAGSKLETFDEGDGFNSCMSNTSKRDVFEGVQFGEEAVLGPGDLLVLPSGWWHAMQGLSTSWSVSVWY